MTLKTLKQNTFLQIFTISLRYLVGSAFVFASIVKIEGKRFTTDSGADRPINDAWHMFETLYQSGLYWNFIGWGQLIAGFLLMSQRFSTLGALSFFPIITNVFVITISYEFAGTPIITFLMLLANIYLLLWDWNKISLLFSSTSHHYEDDNAEFSKRKVWSYLGIFYFIMTIVMRKTLEYLSFEKQPIINPFYLMLILVGMFFLIWLIAIIINLKKKPL